MLKVVFQRLEKSELAKQIVGERMAPLVDRFPELEKEDIVVTLSMENSPIQTGPDLFKVKIQVIAGNLRGLILEKSATNLYTALAYTVDRLHERVSRSSSKIRKMKRNKIRRKKRSLDVMISDAV